MSAYERFDFGQEPDQIEEPQNHDQNLDFAPQTKVDFDQIEIQEEPLDTLEESNEVIINRFSDFFLENNENFKLSWQEVADQLDKDLESDPSKPPQLGLF